VFWVNLAGGTTATQSNFDAYVSAFGENYPNILSAELPTTVTVQAATGVLFQSGTQVLHSVHTMNHPGTDASAYINDKSACKVFSWTSNAYWRGGKPRTYVPGIRTADTTDGHTLNAAADTRLTTKANDLHTFINTLSSAGITNTQHGFVHFFVGGVLQTPGIFYPISGAVIHPRLGSQRRRLGRWLP
jgi:hypothetical protein